MKGEPRTLTWHAAAIEGEPGVYRVFDTFGDEAGREEHLNGPAGQEFVDKADELFSESKMYRLQVIAHT